MSRIPEWLLKKPVAHRGLHDAARGVPENSLPAFLAAAQSGFPAELDVRLLADGEIVVFHDQTLDRLTGEHGPIASRTSEEVRRIILAGTDATIPLLRDVLEAIAGTTPLLIEIKSEGAVGELERNTASILKAYDGPFAIQSFHPETVGYWRDHMPSVVRGLLSGDFRDEKIDAATRERLCNLETMDECAPDFIGYDIRLLPGEPVTRARAAGLPVLGWTARTRDDALKALAHCDNIIFEGFDASTLKGTR